MPLFIKCYFLTVLRKLLLYELTEGQSEVEISMEAGRTAVLPRSGDSFRLGTASVAVCMLRRRLLCLLSIVSVLALAASPAGGARDQWVTAGRTQ